jgi:non-ribosomal peptide synthase protein (TIGR01720 family)
VRLNSGFELGQAPLLRACHFVNEPGGPNFLLLVIHHLVIDVESWRILLAELETLLARRGDVRQSRLETSGSSVSRWANTLQALAGSADLDSDKAYWAGTLLGRPTRVPTDGARSTRSNRERDTVTRSFTIDTDRMAGLQASSREALRASLYEVIVSAVARAVAGWTGAERVVFDVEGHGREPLAGGEAAATIGWLTSMFPLVFDAEESAWSDAIAALRHVKEHIRSLPRKGVTFGILRHLAPTGDRAVGIAAYDGADVLFNYLGDENIGSEKGAILSLVDTRCGMARSPECERAYLVEINAYQSLGALVFDVSYSEELFTTETIEAFGERLLLAMRELADAAVDRDTNATVAADFPLADLSADDLDSIASQLNKLEE